MVRYIQYPCKTKYVVLVVEEFIFMNSNNDSARSSNLKQQNFNQNIQNPCKIIYLAFADARIHIHEFK